MEQYDKVFHKIHGKTLFTVVSPPQKNDFKVMVCETFIISTLETIILTDKPENFYLA